MIKYLFLLLLSFNAYAVDTLGLNYVVYAAGGATPSMSSSGRTILTSGTVPNLNYNWGFGIVMNSGRSDGVIVHFTGSILWPGIAGSGQKSVSFYDRSDDGFYMTINDTVVINNWVEQGPANFNSAGTISLTAGQVYNIDVWWYENGGGAVVQLYWNIGSGIVVVPSSNMATGSSYFVPALCCGGSSTRFNANSTNINKVASFTNRSSSDSHVYIEQIGNDNIIAINQTGTKNNYSNIYTNGLSNNISILQNSNNNTQTNFSDVYINGNYNTVDISQSVSNENTSFGKGVFVNITDNNNSLSISQNNDGSHYANVSLSGGNKTVNITQHGSASHMTDIILSGQTSSLSLSQSGNTQQYYSINFNCATAGGCQRIQVTQGK